MKYPIWKPILILVVIALCLAALYPPSQRLKPGLDLAGGTTLIYAVNVPSGMDSERVIDETIAVLQQRVDPAGVMNLVWRQRAGNRIEVQMPLATRDTADARQVYLSARDALLAGGLTERALDAAMQAEDPQQRSDRLEQLSQQYGVSLPRLQALAEQYDAFSRLARDNQAAQAAYDEAEQALRDLPPTATIDERQALQQTVNTLLEELMTKARAYNAARDAYQQAKQQVLESNVTAAELERVLTASIQPLPDGSTPRAKAAQQLAADHPDKAEQLIEVVQLFNAYEKVKGPLDDPNDLIALLQGSGVLEFRIVGTPGDVPDAGSYRQQLQEQGPLAGRNRAWRWFVIDELEQYVDSARERELLEQDPAGYFASQGVIGDRYGDRYYLLLANQPGRSITQNDEGWELSSVSTTIDEMGRPAIAFTMNALGGALMGQISGDNVGRQMSILLDGKVISSPVLQSKITTRGQITGGSGGFSQQELGYLLRTLRAGSLEGTISEYPISIKTTGPQLGQDNLNSGLRAAVYSLVAVAVFMVFYYFWAGLVADLALVLNMVVILGVMALIQATWTLPGIAGIVLTIGMAVDANVLIFERIREELARKADIATAVRLGYEKALSTILDANLTTLITCLVLGYTATAEVKGFAVTLGIGILATLFTSLFCTRVVIDLLLRYGRVKHMPMLPDTVPAIGRTLEPSVDWIGKRHFFFVVSSILIVAGLSMVVVRGANMLDIEFRSGTQVSFDLREGVMLPIGEVRDRLELYGTMAREIQEGEVTSPAGLEADEAVAFDRLQSVVRDADQRYEQSLADYNQQAADGDAAVPQPERPRFALLRTASVVTEGQTQDNQAGAFSVSTLMTDAQAVSGVIKAAFQDELQTTRPIDFARMEADRVNEAPVFAITTANLGQVVNRPTLTSDVPDYLGGVAILLEDLDPAVTPEQLEQRIRRMRAQPAYEQLGFRPYQVIPVGEPVGTTDGGDRVYSSAVVVARDNETSYIDNPDALTDVAGLASTEWQVVREALRRDTSLASVTSFSAQVSRTMQQQAIVALALSLLAVIAYIWFRFGSIRYGLAAIFALVHDVAVALGLVAISGWLYNNEIAHMILVSDFKIDLALVAALLTIVGYSLNDTIIVFDRIRENRGRLSMETPQIINDSINQTISRTVITSGTTLLAILILYIFGGSGVHGFAFAMLIGIGVGTYSSVAVAAPMLLLMGRGKPSTSTPPTAVPTRREPAQV